MHYPFVVHGVLPAVRSFRGGRGNCSEIVDKQREHAIDKSYSGSESGSHSQPDNRFKTLIWGKPDMLQVPIAFLGMMAALR